MRCCGGRAIRISSSDTMTVGPLTIDTARRLVFVDGERVDLTKREFDLLAVLAENAGVVLSRQRLLELVWGYDFDVDTNVADVFICYLRRKLERDGLPQGDPHGSRDRVRAARRAVEVRCPRFVRSASLRTRVALAAAAAAAAVVAVFTILTSVVLANNDAAQLDRRLDSIVDASMYPDAAVRTRAAACSRPAGRESTGPGGVPARLPAAARCSRAPSTVEVNGVEYRVRTIPVDQQGGVLMSVGIRADSILLNRARIPLYIGGRRRHRADRRRAGLDAGRARDPAAAQADRAHHAAGQGQRADARGARRPRGRGAVRGDDRHAEPARRRAAGHHQLASGRPGFRRQRRARTAHPADRDARRPGHAAHPRPARRGARRGGRRPVRARSAASRRSSPRWASSPRVSSRRPRTAKSSTSPTCSTGWPGRTCGPAASVEIVVERRRRPRHHLGLAGRPAARGRQPGAQRRRARTGDADRAGGSPASTTR